MSIANALLPIVLLIVTGRLLAWRNFPAAGFWPMAERLIYFVLFPCLLFSSIVATPFQTDDLITLMLMIYPPILLIGVVLVIIKPIFGWDGPGFTSVFQGSLRFNTYVGLAIAGTLFGPGGLAQAAVAIGLMVPLLNILCVLALLAYGSGQHRGWSGFVSQLLGNPLILACALGLAVNLSAVQLPEALVANIGFLGRAALPMGLLAVGAGLRLHWQPGDFSGLAVAGAAKLVVMPALVLALAQATQASTLSTQISVLFSALPTATAAFVLARQMGGDHSLMARMITLQTLAAILTLPWVLSWVI